MKAKITLLPGDGIGPEVVAEGVKLLRAVAARLDHAFEFHEALIGGIAIDTTGSSLPEATVAACRRADAVLLGAVGGPKWDDPNAVDRPERGLLGIRKALGLYANLRPVAVLPALVEASPLRPELLDGVDLLVVRELTGGIYFGEKRRWSEDGDERASDLCVYSQQRDRAHRTHCVRAGARPPRQAHKCRQGECARDVAPVAQCRQPYRGGRVPRRRSWSTCWSTRRQCT